MFLSSSLPVLLLCMMTAASADKEALSEAQRTCPVVTCALPGRDGRDGLKGEKGEPGTGQAALTSEVSTWVAIHSELSLQ